MSMNVPDLTTERLTLTPLSEKHAAGMFALWSCLEVCKFSGAAQDLQGEPIHLPARSAEDSDKILQFFMAYQRRSLAIRWAMQLRESNTFVGAAGFNSLGSVCELAYHLHPDYWRRGLMVETCHAIMQWARDELGTNSFVAFIESDNLPSLNLIQRLGFVATDDSRHGARRFTR